MNRNKKKIWLIVPCVIAAMALFIWFFQWLWNAILPEVLGIKVINYWQAFGILVLSKIMFGGFSAKKKSFSKNRCDWDNIEKEKMKAIFKQKFESKFCRTDNKDDKE